MKILLFFLLSIFIWAQEIHINEHTNKLDITRSIHYFITNADQNNYLSILKQNERFKKNDDSPLLLGYLEDKCLWMLFGITNDSNKSIKKILNFNYPIQEDLYLYDLSTDEVYFQGESFSLTPYYIIDFKPHETKYFLIQSHNEDVGTIVDLQLLSSEVFQQQNRHKLIAITLFIGAVGALILYNVFLFFLTKDLSYFYYVIMITIFSIIILYVNGLWSYIFDGFHFSKKILYILLFILAIAMIFFTKTFLDLETKFSKINNLIDLIFVSLIILFWTSMFDLVPTLFQRFYYSLLFLILIFIGIYTYKQGKKEALYYLLGWILLFVSMFALVLRQGGISDIYDQIPYLGYIGVISEAMLFSMALSSRINSMKKERELALNNLIRSQAQKKKDLEKYAKEKNIELQKALNEKALLLKELHHRVKNNLQIIISLLRLQSDKYEDKRLQDILYELENRIRAISRVHEMLYQEDKETKIDMEKYLNDLVSEIFIGFPEIAKNVKFSMICDIYLDVNRAIYCGLIVNELITNSLKYAFDIKGGKIKLSLLKKHDRFILTYFDNGKGFNSQELLKNSLGLKIIQSLAKYQLKGSVQIDGNAGTYVVISFPVD